MKRTIWTAGLAIAFSAGLAIAEDTGSMGGAAREGIEDDVRSGVQKRMPGSAPEEEDGGHGATGGRGAAGGGSAGDTSGTRGEAPDDDARDEAPDDDPRGMDPGDVPHMPGGVPGGGAAGGSGAPGR
jgi:hypothetical protein